MGLKRGRANICQLTDAICFWMLLFYHKAPTSGSRRGIAIYPTWAALAKLCLI
jgi:hypothetical protein